MDQDTFAQSHKQWAFGAFAELVDNSKDAKATVLDINVVDPSKTTGGHMLVLVDNGGGMTPAGLKAMFELSGSSKDKADTTMIGKYGVGFKSGAMTLAGDVLVFTKSTEYESVGLFGNAFNRDNRELHVPIVSWRTDSKELQGGEETLTQLVKSCQFSREWITAQFHDFDNGTKICLFGLSRRDDRARTSDLDFEAEANDIWISRQTTRSGETESFTRHRPGQMGTASLDYSLREYLEMLYHQSNMTIILRGKVVETRPVVTRLRNQKVYRFDADPRVVLTLGEDRVAKNKKLRGFHFYKRNRLVTAFTCLGMQLQNSDDAMGVIGVLHMVPDSPTEKATKCIDCKTNWRVGLPKGADMPNATWGEDGKKLWCVKCAQAHPRAFDLQDDILDWEHTKQKFVENHDYQDITKFCAESLKHYWLDFLERDKLEIVSGQSLEENSKAEWFQCDKCKKWREVNDVRKFKRIEKLTTAYCSHAEFSCSTAEYIPPDTVTTEVTNSSLRDSDESVQASSQKRRGARGSDGHSGTSATAAGTKKRRQPSPSSAPKATGAKAVAASGASAGARGKNFSKEQSAQLCVHFDAGLHSPSSKECDEIAREVTTTSKKVKAWFARKRGASKRPRHDADSGGRPGGTADETDAAAGVRAEHVRQPKKRKAVGTTPTASAKRPQTVATKRLPDFAFVEGSSSSEDESSDSEGAEASLIEAARAIQSPLVKQESSKQASRTVRLSRDNVPAPGPIGDVLRIVPDVLVPKMADGGLEQALLRAPPNALGDTGNGAPDIVTATMAALREQGIGTLPALLAAKPTDAQLKGYGFMLVPRKKIDHVLKTNRPGSPGAFKRP